MVSNWTSQSNRFTTTEEQQLYDHLLQCVEHEAPQQLIERFQALFIDGVGYGDREMVSALDQLVSSRNIDEHFRFIMNRCCHILINRWQSRRQLQTAIPELIELFEVGPTRHVHEVSRGRSIRSLHAVVEQFKETEQYATLRRLAQVVSESPDYNNPEGTRPLGTLIRHYPYLYEHCLVSEDSPKEHQRHVRRIQRRAQQKFEIDLSHYVTYRVRRSRLHKQQPDSGHKTVKLLRPVTNPTLMSDRDLVTSLQHFSYTSSGNSYRSFAKRFEVQSCQTPIRYKAFKDNLYDYITAGIDPEYGRRQFNNLLHNHLIDTYPNSNDKLLDDFLLVRTCGQLFNFLVLDSQKNPEHFVFIDLINNLGALSTTGLLLKVLLLCGKVRSCLERRLSILFNHYESSTRDTVNWLVQVFENLNIALSLNFGSVDLSHVL
ncbi:MAG: hypothetical protein AAF215_06510 [Cyanobacteria bacterium P01_A01_bin.123]